MNNAMATIFKKELARFFGDKRMAFSVILLPALLIYLLYSVMGSALTENLFADDAPPSVAAIGLPESVAPSLSGLSVSEDWTEADAKEAVAAQRLDALIVFPPDFDGQVAAYTVDSGAPAPQLAVYYNSASPDSEAAFRGITEALDAYESSLSNKFDVNADGAAYDLASESDQASGFFAMLLPMLLMIFLFSGCMSVAPEAIAGEKERGTIATLLITPVSRSQIALGKIAALSVIALLSAASSAIGTILSLPKLMGGSLSGAIYSAREYLLLAGIILSTVLLLITLISILSAFAKSTKEAQTLVLPLMILVMFIGVTAMFGSAAESTALYVIPLYNSVQCMARILTFDIHAAQFLPTILSNLLFTALGVWVLTRLFRSERVIFSK